MNNFLKLKIGDEILLNGAVFTLRDRAHLFLLKNEFPKIRNSIIFHCGPLLAGDEIISAGPTTSARFNSYTPELIEKYSIRAIIGKGGMDDNVLKKMRGKVVYFSAIGGAGALYAKCMKVIHVYKRVFGMAEAIWELEVKDFPVIVTMDAWGNSLHKEILEQSFLQSL